MIIFIILHNLIYKIDPLLNKLSKKFIRFNGAFPINIPGDNSFDLNLLSPDVLGNPLRKI
tara:strand:+ start:336 stop:515 length:180 start_codon:yes stop_codon:yes gene_type:complete